MPARATPDLAVPAGNQPVAVVLILWTHADPLGALWEGVGRQGGMKPGGRGIFAIGTKSWSTEPSRRLRSFARSLGDV